MDSISEIIQTFSTEQIKEFRLFINRRKQKKTRKDLELFEIFISSPQLQQKEIVEKLYGSNKTVAYHALRKKLIRHLTDFMTIKQLDNDSSGAANIMGMISLAQYLFENQSDRLAWRYLRKAETLAQEHEQYEQLNIIYKAQFDNLESEGGPEFEKVLQKYNKNKQLVDQNERANIAYCTIKHKLKKAKVEGVNIDFDLLIANTLKEQKLETAFFSRPRIFFQVINIFRSAVIAKKDYYSFEPFVITNYKQFCQSVGFNDKNIEYKANLQYIIAHTLYRNKKFHESLTYLTELEQTVISLNRTFILKHYPRFILLVSANLFFTHNIHEALEKLTDSLTDPELKLQIADRYTILLNLSFFHIYNNDPSTANRFFMQMSHSNAWYEKVAGKEWVLKKSLVDIIIQYELGNEEIALNRIRSIERTNELLKSDKRYERVKTFLSLTKQIICEPFDAPSTSFFDKVENSFEWIPLEQEDLQAVMFYAWFKSKIVKKTAYQVLQEVLQEN